MIHRRRFSILRTVPAVFAYLLAGSLLPVDAAWADDLRAPLEIIPPAFKKKLPETIEELKEIEEHVAKVVELVMPAVVSVRVGAAFGSGVIVKDGYILTAGHVSGSKPNTDVIVYFHNRKQTKAKTLGGNMGLDSGLMKITEEGDWPYVEMGNSAELKTDQWCMVCAHPGGFKPGRTPPVRLGRIKGISSSTLTTECTLVGGDSGGPLFDMHGRVIGINSRIGGGITQNMHVPVNPFRDSWDKLAKGEIIGGKSTKPAKGAMPYIGATFDKFAKACIVTQVVPNSPADKAGLMVDDVILKADDKALESGDALEAIVGKHTPGNKMVLSVQRGDDIISVTVEIGKR